jgi:hypothetical protein
MWQELYFDVDYDNGDYNEGAKMLQLTMDTMEDTWDMSTQFDIHYDKTNNIGQAGARKVFMPGLPFDKQQLPIREMYQMGKPMIVFSGGKGFHLIYPEFRIKNLIKDYDKIWAHIPSGIRQQLSREIRRHIITTMTDSAEVADNGQLLLDWEVTTDPRRIIRLPGTVHGKTLRVCKVITDMTDFTKGTDDKIVGYTPDDPIG